MKEKNNAGKNDLFEKNFQHSIFKESIEKINRRKELSYVNAEDIMRKLERFLMLFETVCQKNSNKLTTLGDVSLEKQQFIIIEKKTSKKFTYDFHFDKERECVVLKTSNQHYRTLPWTLEDIAVKKIIEDGLILVVKKVYETHISA